MIPHGTPQTYTVDFTASQSNTAITFAFREDPAFVFVFNTSVVNLTTSSGNLLTNGDFSGGTYTDNGNSATPTGWTYANIYGASAGGVVTSSCEGYGSHCWYDGAVQAYDAISQTISTTAGDRYQASFSATDNSDLTDWSRVSTNGDVTGTGGNGADILVYAQAGLPPPGCAGAPGVNIKASAGETCFASGSYVSTDVIAGQATGAGALVTNVNEGQSSVSFSTSAANTPAVQADAGGSVTLAATPPSTSATVTTTGNNSIGLYATGFATTEGGETVFSTISATNVNVSTQGTNAHGVQADSGGAVILNGGSVSTAGTSAIGLYATGAGSTITTTNLAGSGLVTIATSGFEAYGVLAADGAVTSVVGGSINTAGDAAYAVAAVSGGLVSLNGTAIGTTGKGSGGLGINGGGEIDATNVTITTTGAYDPVSGEHSYGVYNGPFQSFTSGGVAKLTDVSVSTQGAEMYGVVTNTGGATTILGGSIATAGSGAHAILSEDGGTTTVNVSASGPTTIATSGTSAAAAAAYDGVVQLTGATATTSGAGSTALAVIGATSSLSANGVSVTTQGGIDPATGDPADGAFNGPYLGLTSGGLLSLTNSTIATIGAGADGVATGAGGTTTISGTNVATSGPAAVGVLTSAGGVTNMSGGSVATSGQDAHALFVTGSGSKANLSGSGSFSTGGNGAIGLYATAGGVISATGPATTTITTAGGVSPATGLGAYGVNADGVGSADQSCGCEYHDLGRRRERALRERPRLDRLGGNDHRRPDPSRSTPRTLRLRRSCSRAMARRSPRPEAGRSRRRATRSSSPTPPMRSPPSTISPSTTSPAT